MTCAHIVNVAMKKLPGVQSVAVSLNQALVTVKLNPGNTISVQQLWQLLRAKGYTPKLTVITVRGDLIDQQGNPQLKVSGTKDVITVAPEANNGAAWQAMRAKTGQELILHGNMIPSKDLKASVPLMVLRFK